MAVELALRGAGVAAGDEVLLAGYDFSGNFRSIEAIGARPVLVDVGAEHAQLDLDLLEAAVGPQTRAVVATHLHGGLLPMRDLTALARRLGLAVVEDACQAPGGVVNDRPVGTWGDAACLSFGGSKLLSAGRGGAVLTSSGAIHQRIKVYSERGNHAFPLSELQAAVLAPQLAALPAQNARRRAAVARLLDALADVPGIRPLAALGVDDEPVYYKLGFWYKPDELGGVPREQFVAAVRAEGVALDAGFRDFARRSAARCRHAGPLPHSRHAGECLLVLHHPVLLEAEETIDAVARAIRKVAVALQNAAGGVSSG